MQITHLGHAAVLVETAGQRVLIDPGNFSAAWHDLSDLDAICVTHQHLDHIDLEHLPKLLEANPDAQLWVEPGVAESFHHERLSAFHPGAQIILGDLKISARGGKHAVIHRDIPMIGNIGLLCEAPSEPTFFHPGDCLDEVPSQVDIVAIPAYGPWAAMKETIDFVRAVGAPHGFPIHEGLLNERGWALLIGRFNAMTSTEVQDLRHGQAVTFTRS